jgi:hypothetical protein
MPDFMCQYASCSETETPITVTIKGDPGDRVRFCCLTHLSLWSRNRAKRNLFVEAKHASQDELAEADVR